TPEMASPCAEITTGTDDRGAADCGVAPVAFTRLAMRSAALDSAILASAASASTGRGRGNGLAGAEATAGKVVIEPNIGAGWRPAWKNKAFVMIAVTTAKAIAPAMISFGLRRKI